MHVSNSSANRRTALVVAALALFAFGLSAQLSRTVFERLPHLEDEMAYLWGARVIAGGNFVIESPLPTRSYWQPFLVDREGVRFSKYAPGWSLQLAVGVLMGQAWIINALAAALTVALTYRIGRMIIGGDLGRRTGLIAAGLVAVSPAALLLNASLMGHTTALTAAAVFIVAVLHLHSASGRSRWVWAVAGGVALGLLALNRPLTAVAVGAPFALWTGVALLRDGAAARSWTPIRRAVPVFSVLGGLALALASVIFVYNYQATGNPRANLYTLVWEYDRIGFGTCCGRSGHTLEKGVRHMRFDLSLTAADLFGWHAPVMIDGVVMPDLVDHWLNQADYLPTTGWSWVLLPLGLIVAFRWRALLLIGWLGVGYGILALPFALDGAASREPAVGWAVVIALLAWANLPLVVIQDRRRAWLWALIAVALSLIIVQLAYWIGSQRYSTRYYYEGLISAAILTALPVGWLWGRLRGSLRLLVPAVAALVMAYSLTAYGLPRVGTLYGFNFIDRRIVEGVEARREGDRPVLVLVNGTDVRWRAYGALMAYTSPYLDSPIVAARAASQTERNAILARFPDRQVIEMDAVENQAAFRD